MFDGAKVAQDRGYMLFAEILVCLFLFCKVFCFVFLIFLRFVWIPVDFNSLDKKKSYVFCWILCMYVKI
jgi:hypothetical protein